MKISFNSGDEAFRNELREFLAQNHPGKSPKGHQARLQHQKDWAATLFDNGWAAPNWPQRYGGMDLSFSRKVIYGQEMAAARVPHHPNTTLDMVGPTLIKFGDDAQRDRYLQPMLRGDEIWAQAFSEPEAGSDLPSLRATATRDGDTYVVNGQKVWNSNADIADMFFALVRTGPPDSRQKGISYLLIDAATPGVTVARLRDITGSHHFCDIFFDDVVVPVDNRVGPENDGWRITRNTLGHERSAGALNQAGFYRRVMDELIALAHERGLTADPVLRRRLTDFAIRSRIMEINAMRTISAVLVTGEPGGAASVSRLYNSEFEKELHEFAVSLLGAHGALSPEDPESVQRGRWVGGMLRTRASTIGAGTAEIQRNTIAEQVLGLPYDPAMPPR